MSKPDAPPLWRPSWDAQPLQKPPKCPGFDLSMDRPPNAAPHGQLMIGRVAGVVLSLPLPPAGPVQPAMIPAIQSPRSRRVNGCLPLCVLIMCGCGCLPIDLTPPRPLLAPTALACPACATSRGHGRQRASTISAWPPELQRLPPVIQSLVSLYSVDPHDQTAHDKPPPGTPGAVDRPSTCAQHARRQSGGTIGGSPPHRRARYLWWEER